MAIGRVAGATVAVVCDGVSSSARPDTAAHAAVDAGHRRRCWTPCGRARIRRRRAGAAPGRPGRRGARGRLPDPGSNPPSCHVRLRRRRGRTRSRSAGSATAGPTGWPDEAAGLTRRRLVAGPRGSWPAGAGGAGRGGSAAGALCAGSAPTPTTTHAARHTLHARPVPAGLLVCSDGLFRYRPRARPSWPRPRPPADRPGAGAGPGPARARRRRRRTTSRSPYCRSRVTRCRRSTGMSDQADVHGRGVPERVPAGGTHGSSTRSSPSPRRGAGTGAGSAGAADARRRSS